MKNRGIIAGHENTPNGRSGDPGGRHPVSFMDIQGESQARRESESKLPAAGSMALVREEAERVASVPVSVLLTGETGTGKELVAHEIHRLSERRAEAFVTINCAAIPETLFESELFGHDRGAFTGAVRERDGKIALSDQGTLFLDEIGELRLDLQAKLLRVLQERIHTRLGSEKELHSDFRLISATNRDLAGEVRAGRFRADLYYRIKEYSIHLPPLRERLSELDILLPHLVSGICASWKKPVPAFSDDLLPFLRGYSWPGNVRELENAIRGALVSAGNRGILEPSDFRLDESVPLMHAGGDAVARALRCIGEFLVRGKTGLREVETLLLGELLRRFRGSISAASSATGIAKAKFYRHRPTEDLQSEKWMADW